MTNLMLHGGRPSASRNASTAAGPPSTGTSRASTPASANILRANAAASGWDLFSAEMLGIRQKSERSARDSSKFVSTRSNTSRKGIESPFGGRGPGREGVAGYTTL